MVTSLKRFKWLSIPIVIVLAISGMSAVIYKLHVAANRVYLSDRNFRLFTSIGNQITARIENYYEIFNSAASLEGHTDVRPTVLSSPVKCSGQLNILFTDLLRLD